MLRSSIPKFKDESEKIKKETETKWQRSRWKWNTYLSMDASGTQLQMQKISQNISWEWAGVSDHQKGIYRSIQYSVGWGKEGKKGRVSRTGAATEARSRSLHWGNYLDRGEAFEAIGVCSSWSVRVWIEWEPHRQSLPKAYVLCTGTQVPCNMWCLGAGVKGLENNPKVRSAVDYGKMTHGDVRGETAVGNTFGEKLGSHGGKVTLLSHVLGVEPSM